MRTNAATTLNCYVSFREWVNSNYHSMDDEVWSEIIEDYLIDYDNLGNRSYENVEEEEVINDDIMIHDGYCSSDLIS